MVGKMLESKLGFILCGVSCTIQNISKEKKKAVQGMADFIDIDKNVNILENIRENNDTEVTNKLYLDDSNMITVSWMILM